MTKLTPEQLAEIRESYDGREGFCTAKFSGIHELLAHVLLAHLEALQPGFLVLTYDPAMGQDTSDLRLGPKVWAELERKGFSGGIVIQKGMTVESLDDETMAALGWQRIQK